MIIDSYQFAKWPEKDGEERKAHGRHNVAGKPQSSRKHRLSASPVPFVTHRYT